MDDLLFFGEVTTTKVAKYLDYGMNSLDEIILLQNVNPYSNLQGKEAENKKLFSLTLERSFPFAKMKDANLAVKFGKDFEGLSKKEVEDHLL